MKLRYEGQETQTWTGEDCCLQSRFMPFVVWFDQFETKSMLMLVIACP